jgi:hypothetical protein
MEDIMSTTLKLPVITTELLAARRIQQQRYVAPKAVEAICAALAAPIEAALAAVNGRAGSFTVTRAYEVAHYADEAEAALERAGIPQSDRPGTIVTAQPAGPSANKYGYRAVSTSITLVRRRNGEWLLTGIRRTEVYPKQPARFNIEISAAAGEAATRAALRPFVVRHAAPAAVAA